MHSELSVPLPVGKFVSTYLYISMLFEVNLEMSIISLHQSNQDLRVYEVIIPKIVKTKN